MEAEREVAAYYAALFMTDKVGERYPGTVAAVAEPGLFVELTPFFVEGLVRAEELPGAFELDPVHHALVDRGHGPVLPGRRLPGGAGDRRLAAPAARRAGAGLRPAGPGSRRPQGAPGPRAGSGAAVRQGR